MSELGETIRQLTLIRNKLLRISMSKATLILLFPEMLLQMEELGKKTDDIRTLYGKPIKIDDSLADYEVYWHCSVKTKTTKEKNHERKTR